MTNLVRASRELFSRTPDETFDSFGQLSQYCSTLQEHSIDRWEPPEAVTPALLDNGQLGLSVGSTGQFQLNDWSFGQLCGLARVDRLTLNRLRIETAIQALGETLPRGRKPLQVLTTDDRVRSVRPEKPNSIKIMDTKHRWASCTSSGNLNFHWKCMMAPLTVIDYIIVHELAHLIHSNHSAAFWNEVDKGMPDFHERKSWLRENGSGMDL